MFRLPKPTPELLQRVLEEQRSLPFSYEPVGASAGVLPGGFRHDHFETDLGADEGDRFARAREAIWHWVPQVGAGIEVFPEGSVTPDLTMVLSLPLPVAGWAIAPARVVYVVDEPDRAGYAYGSLPAHPEQGEEAFIARRQGGRIRFHVIAYSRPGALLTRLGGPVARAFQVRTITTYLRVMEGATR